MPEPALPPPATSSSGRGRLLAVSDLHVRHAENREVVNRLRPGSDADWLLVAGDVSESADEVVRTLDLLRRRFAHVVWAPGNHELWTTPSDPVRLRGEERYRHLVARCRDIGVTTPEDPYPVWEGEGGPVVVAPLFLLYDYTFRPPGTRTREEALERAGDAGVLCTDEMYLHPDPYPSREAWCRARVAATEARLAALPPDLPTVLVNHFPLVREPTRVLRYPEFALWCGTEATEDWPVRFRAAAVVYGHLHIPRVIRKDGVPHVEVSLGYPREWKHRATAPALPVPVLPVPVPSAQGENR
ncbi:metallophosphoesterase family protein [Streptomyces sp. NPDC093546]|uniref:metallophosphoesterase family protein n=1 Tax=Streptomyces sp. NPDC093546 TaxID=3366040 RepID=UPI00380129CB